MRSRTRQRASSVFRPRASAPHSLVLLVALVSWMAQGCSSRRYYDCADESGSIPSCYCNKVSQAKNASPCKRQYDCCAEFEYRSIMVDDPNRGAGCVCWMLEPGDKCEDGSRWYSGTVTNRPSSCSSP
jgi:hypothetical protein